MNQFLTVGQVAEVLNVSKETVRRWDKSGKLKATRSKSSGYRQYDATKFHQQELPLLKPLQSGKSSNEVRPKRRFTSIELFAGAGGLALGLEKAGLECLLLNEIDRSACQTLRLNRPTWNVVEGDISKIDFHEFNGQVDVITGGFPCQAFSYAGKKLGFEDARGTLFYEFARAVKEVQPLVAVGENVRGLLSHDGGKTISGMVSILEELGYAVVLPRVLKAIHYQVPQKRERLFLVAVRKDIQQNFEYPLPDQQIYTLKDALKKGELFKRDVPKSPGQAYPEKKAKLMALVPPGGYWRDLPLDLQKQYMQKSFYLGGGKTGIARRISWDEPSLTLTCAPAQKQTERCHPEETRPFTVREYARIQTFPDDWEFAGSMTAQYKQIGNAVPVNLAFCVGQSIVRLLNRHFEVSKI